MWPTLQAWGRLFLRFIRLGWWGFLVYILSVLFGPRELVLDWWRSWLRQRIAQEGPVLLNPLWRYLADHPILLLWAPVPLTILVLLVITFAKTYGGAKSTAESVLRMYRLKGRNVHDIRATVATIAGGVRTAVDPETNTLIVTGTNEQHDQIEGVLHSLGVEWTSTVPEKQSEPIRAKLEEATRTGNALLGTVVARSTQFSAVSVDHNLTSQMEQWTGEIFAYLSEHAPEYAADFLSPMPAKVGIFGPTIAEVAEILRRRLANLRGILRDFDRK